MGLSSLEEIGRCGEDVRGEIFDDDDDEDGGGGGLHCAILIFSVTFPLECIVWNGDHTSTMPLQTVFVQNARSKSICEGVCQ